MVRQRHACRHNHGATHFIIAEEQDGSMQQDMTATSEIERELDEASDDLKRDLVGLERKAATAAPAGIAAGLLLITGAALLFAFVMLRRRRNERSD